MSIKTWRQEFYPKPAKRVSKAQALDHSIQKWTGLLPANLKRHDVKLQGTLLMDPNYDGWYAEQEGRALVIGASSCALCRHYLNEDADYFEQCVGCPLYKLRNGRCDERLGRSEMSPYGALGGAGDPKPMLALLKRAKCAEERAAAKRSTSVKRKTPSRPSAAEHV